MLSSTLPAGAAASGLVTPADSPLAGLAAPSLSAGAALISDFGDGGGSPPAPAVSFDRGAAAFARGSSADFGTKVFRPVGPAGAEGGGGGAAAVVAVVAATATTAAFCFVLASFSFCRWAARSALSLARSARHAPKFVNIFSSSEPMSFMKMNRNELISSVPNSKAEPNPPSADSRAW